MYVCIFSPYVYIPCFSFLVQTFWIHAFQCEFFHKTEFLISLSLLYVSKSINQFQPTSALNLRIGEPRLPRKRRV